MMSLIFAPVKHWISQAFDLVLHIHFRSNAEVYFFTTGLLSISVLYLHFLALSFQHVVEVLKILLYSVLSVFTLDTFISLLFHFFSRSVISISETVLNELFTVFLDYFEMI